MKIRIALIVEFEIHYDLYEEGTTPEEILDIEITNAKDDPVDFINLFSDENLIVTGELIEGGDS